MSGGPEKRADLLTIHVPARLRAAVERQASQRLITVDRFVLEVLDGFLHDLTARTSGLQRRPEPPRSPDRSLTILHDPEGRIRDTTRGRQWQTTEGGKGNPAMYATWSVDR